jgi:hypothetical protein
VDPGGHLWSGTGDVRVTCGQSGGDARFRASDSFGLAGDGKVNRGLTCSNEISLAVFVPIFLTARARDCSSETTKKMTDSDFVVIVKVVAPDVS